MPKTSAERILIVAGFVLYKLVLLYLKISDGFPLDDEEMLASYGEIGLAVVFGALTIKRFRIPTILLGGYMLVAHAIPLALALKTTVEALVAGGIGEMPLPFLIAMICSILIVYGGYRLIRLAVKEEGARG